MSSNIYIDNISKYLLLYGNHVRLMNLSNLTNAATLAENLFCKIFNITLGSNLINANSVQVNQKAYDLFDESRKLYIQVTARQDYNTKFKSTIDAFYALNKPKGSELIIFFISNNIPKNLLKTVTENGLTYYASDIDWLMKRISFLDVLKLKEIDELLTAELFANTPTTLKQIAPQDIVRKVSGFYITRKKLETELFEFTQLSNGLLIGGPGYGKSLLINALQNRYYDNALPCYVIRVNELALGDRQEISEMLGLNQDWISHLSQISTDSVTGKGLIIFDAFDTAKEEQLKATVFKQIRSAINDLKNWNILVSTRTYDATKSFTLQELFPLNRIRGTITCRHMEVPAFSDEELKIIMSEQPYLEKNLKSVLRRCRSYLKSHIF